LFFAKIKGFFTIVKDIPLPCRGEIPKSRRHAIHIIVFLEFVSDEGREHPQFGKIYSFFPKQVQDIVFFH